MSILAGDVGGTKTVLGLFDPTGPRPRPLAVRTFQTLDYPGLASMLTDFREQHARGVAIDSACFGVAGPVIGARAQLTNVPWEIDRAETADTLGTRRVRLLNDLEATAYALALLEPSELLVLQMGDESRGGNRALIAAGTGLGEALLHRVNDRFVPSPTEAGHADFAARNEQEIKLVRQLIQKLGRAEVEQVVSGRGLVNIARVTHAVPCAVLEHESSSVAPSAISEAALGRRCKDCVAALGMFIEAYGAEAGNLALRSMATGGVFVGGGIAPKILEVIADGRFIRAFADKAPFDQMLRAIPVKVVLNDQAGLIGAASCGWSLLAR